jgi:DNA-binding MurR/RpiR family transcriptional regulator
MRKGDALIAISFHPYGQETQAVARDAIERGIPVVLLTDSELSPLASEATAVLALKEADVHGIRSLSASLCVAQALSIGLTEASD